MIKQGTDMQKTKINTAVVEPAETTEQTEVPYKLPEGWKWESVNNIADIFTGNSINETVKKEKYTGISEGLNFIGTKDIDFDGTINYENGVKISDYENFKTIPPDTPLLCIEGGSAGKKIGITSEKVCFGNKLCAFVCKNVEQKLLYYYLQSNVFFYSFMKERHGLIGGVSVGTLKNIPFPLPLTIEEQRRIVKCIESLFEKLDAAKEKAQNVLDSFETRKAAVLHKAFSGELKIENKELSGDDWKNVSLGDVVTGFKYGIADKCDYNNTGIPVLRIPNVGDSNIDFSDIKYSSNKNIDENYLVKKNDILIIRSNGSRDLVGKSALFEVENEKFSYGSFLIKITPTEHILPKYLVLFLNSNDARFQMFYKAKSSSGIHNINSKELAAIKLKLPPIDYQFSIVNFLDNILQKEQKAKQSAQTVLEQIDLLKKSILARAFRGEL